jgi:hypothetical protein
LRCLHQRFDVAEDGGWPWRIPMVILYHAGRNKNEGLGIAGGAMNDSANKAAGEKDAAKTEEIKRRQTLLFDAFSYNGVLGKRYLGKAMDLEKAVGEVFVRTYHGHRVLTDSFLDFFGGTLLQQIVLNNKVGWPNEEENYATCLMMYLTIFRSIRASEIASVHAYPLQGYTIQRSIKDQAFVLCAAASGIASFGRLFGWEGLPEGETPETREELVVKNRRKIEAAIKDRLIGAKSDLKPETIKLLLKLDQMFNIEAHRGLFSLFRESHKVMVEHKLDVSLVPSSDPLRDAMFVNRATETNWMVHRLVPYMRRKDTPADEEWAKKWKLLDEHFRWMVEGLGAIGKEVAGAFIEFIDAKFKFDATTHYSEPKVAEPKEKL